MSRLACALLLAGTACVASASEFLTEEMLRITMPADAASRLTLPAAEAVEYNASTALDFVYHRCNDSGEGHLRHPRNHAGLA